MVWRSLLVWATLVVPLGAGTGRLDELVLARQAETGFALAAVCSDEVFVRRVFIDVIGTLPTADEARAFLASDEADKRAVLIDHLLERPEYADYVALKWGDLLRLKAEFPSNLWPNGVQAYHGWIREAVRQNMRYDDFARALLTASGSNFRDPPANFYRPFQERTPRRIAETVCLVFMGVRLENVGWDAAQLFGLDAFFATVAYKRTGEWKEEIVFSDPDRAMHDPISGAVVRPQIPGEPALELAPGSDPRVAFAAWLTAPENPYFARNIANRVWFWLLGRGLIHEVDDVRPGQAAWSEPLLAHLAQELVTHDYDLRHLYRIILNSDTYQRESATDAATAADVAGFSTYRLRRLDAEVLIDAINQVTGTGEEYVSEVPEPFTFVPATRRSIALADGSTRSPFSELFGRPGRDTSFEAERNLEPSSFQALHLLNSSHLQNKVMRGPALVRLARGMPNPRRRVNELYLTILSRPPTAAEMTVALDYVNAGEGGQVSGFQDLAWALLNTHEFLLKH